MFPLKNEPRLGARTHPQQDGDRRRLHQRRHPLFFLKLFLTLTLTENDVIFLDG